MRRFAARRAGRAGSAVLVLATVAAGVVGIVVTAAPAQATVFSNTTTITVPDATCPFTVNTSTPYPSNITVSGLSGTVSDVNVTLSGMTHPFEGDFEILLVSPAGGTHNLEVLSDAGTGSLSNATVTFDDAAAEQPPQNTAWGPGTYKPVNYTEITSSDSFPSPAPAPSSNTTLAGAFNGTNPNGTWSLYVVDDACGDSGSVNGGWSLDITTIAGAETTTSIGSSLNPSRTGQNVTFTATVTSGGSPVTTGTVTFTDGGTTLAANIALNGSGQATTSTNALTEGDHTITASYSGAVGFGTSSGALNQRVDNNTTVSGTTYCNTGAVTMPSAIGKASPYPSNVFVTSFGGTVGKVTVALKNVTHTFDGDIDALLVGPAGQNLVIVSDAGTAAVTNVTVNLDDAASSSLPAAGAWAVPNSTITVKPTNYTDASPDSFPAPAPAPSADTTLATFNGSDPNGTWRLYAVGDGAPDTGSIAGGWCITLTAAKANPTIATQASAGGPAGTSVTDVATVSGGAGPTGNVTFRLFSDAACAAQVFTSTNNLSGGSATSGGFTTTGPGTYYWTAVYNGDANNSTATSACGAANESVTIGKASPSISTQASAGGAVGTSVTDVATVSGGFSPSGNVTFRLFSDAACAAQLFTSTNSLSGGSATSGGFTTTGPGTYYWTAVYNGDANNSTATSACGAANESVTIGKASPSISTQASAGGAVGTSVTDVATVGGGFSPAGNVTFKLFSNAACTTQVFTSTNSLSGGSATSGGFTAVTPGTYYWTAVYNGDGNNSTATSACGAPNESVVITKASPTISTQASSGGPSGTSVTDVATVGGGFSPTGNVTFKLFSDAACTTQVFTSTNSLSGGSATSGGFTAVTPGTYFWTAVYNGDANNGAATSACGAANESVVITKASPTISTQGSAGGPVGTAITDVATVGGGFSPSGNVTFKLFSDAACTTQVFTSTNSVVSGKATSGGFTTSAPGTYYWTAVYNGDANNNTATSACGAPNESVVITKASPTISTQASGQVPIGGSVSDTATVSGGFTPTGNVTFRLYSNAACTTQVFTSTNSLSSGSATSGSFTPAALGTYYWTAVYNGDANNNTAASACGAPNESVLVGKASPTMSTQASAGGPVGATSVSDTSTLAGAFSPTGNVTFRLFSNAACTTQVFTSTNSLSGASAASGSFTPAAPGTYYWTAVYNGDANNNTATSACGVPNESVVITKASPTISTQAAPGNLLGAPVRDVATVAGGFSPTGAVTFRLFSNAACTTQVFTSTNGLAALTATSGWFTPAAAGTYYWTAVYNGDANNNTATSACGAANESVVIAPFQAPPTTKTITGDFNGPLVVNRGESVLVTGARVNGPVTVNPGGALTVVNSKISNGVTADAPAFFSLCGTDVTGKPASTKALTVTNAAVPIRVGDAAAGCAGNRIAGDVAITANLAVTFGNNTAATLVAIDNNGPGNTIIKANTFFATLSCTGNNPPPTNAGLSNSAPTKTGQCSSL